MKKLTLLLCVIAMFGCSSSQKLAKPGVTQNEWYADYYECSVHADQAIGYNTAYRTALGNAIASGTEHQNSFDCCFETKGYQKVSVDEYEHMTAK
jgi:uncharacterized protein YceK